MTRAEILAFKKYAAISFDVLNTKFMQGVQRMSSTLPSSFRPTSFTPPSISTGKLSINTALNPKGLSDFNIGGKTFKFQNDIGQRIMKANQDFYKATGKNINITSAYRSPQEQMKILQRYGANPNVGIPGVVAPVGKSRHQKGLAVDIGNWQEAAPYLRRYGLNNPLPKDRVHFQL